MDKGKAAWYLKPYSIVIAILFVGPFAIPLVWLTPAFNRWVKVAVTILLAIFTIIMIKYSADTYKYLLKEAQNLQAILK